MKKVRCDRKMTKQEVNETPQLNEKLIYKIYGSNFIWPIIQLVIDPCEIN